MKMFSPAANVPDTSFRVISAVSIPPKNTRLISTTLPTAEDVSPRIVWFRYEKILFVGAARSMIVFSNLPSETLRTSSPGYRKSISSPYIVLNRNLYVSSLDLEEYRSLIFFAKSLLSAVDCVGMPRLNSPLRYSKYLPVASDGSLLSTMRAFFLRMLSSISKTVAKLELVCPVNISLRSKPLSETILSTTKPSPTCLTTPEAFEF